MDGTARVTSTANELAGNYTVTASTEGAVSSTSFQLTNSALPTHTALNITQRTVQPGEVVQGTITVTSTVRTPSGDVALLYGSSELGRATLVTGTATATGTVPTEPGDHAQTARFLGTATYTSSQSAAVTITVRGAADAGADARSDASTSDAGTLDASRVDSGATPDGSTVVDSGSGTDASSPPTPSAGAGGGCQTGPQATSTCRSSDGIKGCQW